jgi:hypothetical protein
MNRAGQETEFGGQTFRSRTEARWAAFLTALDVEFIYEPRRYTLSTGETYLPDFWIKPFRAFLEVKPSSEEVRDAERRRMEMFAAERQDTDLRFWISRGPPNSRENYIEDLGSRWGGAQIVGYGKTGLFLLNRDHRRTDYGSLGNTDKPRHLRGEHPPEYAQGLIGETREIRQAYLAASAITKGVAA